jgi:hypothetical protein
MTRRFVHFATALSLLLAVASAGICMRSQSVDEAWEFEPRAVPGPWAGESSGPGGSGPWTGWRLRQRIGSAGGRLVFVAHEEPTWANSPPVTTGYLSPAALPSSALDRSAYVLRTYSGAATFRWPGVFEWASAPSQRRRGINVGRQRYVAVSWLVPAAAGIVLPATAAWRRWRRWQRSRGPAFPVALPPPPAPAGREASGADVDAKGYGGRQKRGRLPEGEGIGTV